MKRGTLDHPKFMELVDKSQMPAVLLAGVLERLWMWVARYTPQGNIGKYSDAAILKAIGWDEVMTLSDKVMTGDRLLTLLVETGWLDRHDSVRLMIHDWCDHSPDHVDKYLADKGLNYADGTPTRRPRRSDKVMTQSDKVMTLSGSSRKKSSLSVSEVSLQRSVPSDEGDGHDQHQANGVLTACFDALVETGKFPQLTYEHLTAVDRAYPMAQLREAENWQALVLEAKGVAGVIGSAMPWLRKAVSRIEVRNLEQIKLAPGVTAGPAGGDM